MNAYAALERISEAAPMHAEKWLTALFEAIFSLDKIPARCPFIPEAKELGYPVRHGCMAKEKAFTESSLTSERTNSICGFCACGILPVTRSQPPTWRTNSCCQRSA
jgi:hypothetical protein